jgi:hypothetical protein
VLNREETLGAHHVGLVSEAREIAMVARSRANNLFERMRDMHRSWLERLREIRQIESDFGARLLIAKSPSEATAICNEWMTKRLEIAVSEQQTFAAAWLGLISDATKATPAI